ncbi:glycosyltransferase [Butyrivibrio sp. FCS006]|uniref:glycosyltransferase n=1 Tax=Butyrivibrio sp. FCS006 TaxID=1280684 RepID=UPI00041208F1|nr:glycosyltransferase [Butyrivibrio sp. FCS006]
MKKIAIIAPCILPIPATRGGAVEGLVTRLLDDNELNRDFCIDLFTIACDDMAGSDYSFTEILTVENDIGTRLADKIIDKYYRTVANGSSRRLLDKKIAQAFIRRLKEMQDRYDAVVVENMMSTAVEIVHLCNGKYKFPIYFHMHNDVDIYRSPRHIHELVRYGVQFIAVSDYIKRQIVRSDKNAIVSILYNGVNLNKYDKCSKIPDKYISFLYAGRIIPGKGVKELVTAFILMLNRVDENVRKNIKLIIVGFSGVDKRYENLIKAMVNECDNIECMDQIPATDMPVLYDGADVVVMPTVDEEPFGLVALETIAKGIPLITTDSGALPEVVDDGALIVKRDKEFIEKLCDAMQKMVSEPSVRKELSDKAYHRAHENKDFDIRNYYNNFRVIIDPRSPEDDGKISVIIPVYNVAEYLMRCLLSITGQTYKNLEIILVDDGSTDDSGAICDQLAASDDRIKVFHQDNAGLSKSRNTGLDQATGRYIFFCDSDDFLREDALDIMMHKLLDDHADIVACGIVKVHDNGLENKQKEEIFTDLRPGRWSGHESVIRMMRSNNICTVAWNKLYKRELFEGVRFPASVQNEDEATVYKLLYKAGIVSYISDTLYKYYQRNDSIMHEDLETRYHFFLQASLDRMDYFHKLGEADLEDHSRITLLEWIKYTYRNIDDPYTKKELMKAYKENITFQNVPKVVGIKKSIALLAWKYIKY